MLSIFSMIWSLLEHGWRLAGWALEVLGKLAMGSLHIVWRSLTGVLDLLAGGLSRGMDALWDMGRWSGFSLAGIVWGALAVLLAACAVIAAAAAAGNVYRRLRAKHSRRLREPR